MSPGRRITQYVVPPPPRRPVAAAVRAAEWLVRRAWAISWKLFDATTDRLARPAGWRRAIAGAHLDEVTASLRAVGRGFTRSRVLIGVVGPVVVSAGVARFNIGHLPRDPLRVAASAILVGWFGIVPFVAFGLLAVLVFHLLLLLLDLTGAPPLVARRLRRQAWERGVLTRGGAGVRPPMRERVEARARAAQRSGAAWVAATGARVRELQTRAAQIGALRACEQGGRAAAAAARARLVFARGWLVATWDRLAAAGVLRPAGTVLRSVGARVITSPLTWDALSLTATLVVTSYALVAGAAAVLHWLNSGYEALRVIPPWPHDPPLTDSVSWVAPTRHLRSEVRRGVGLSYNLAALLSGTGYGFGLASLLGRGRGAAKVRRDFAGGPIRSTADAVKESRSGAISSDSDERRHAGTTIALSLAVVVAPWVLAGIFVFGASAYPELTPQLGGGAAAVVRFATREGDRLKPVPGLLLPAALLAQEGTLVTALTCAPVVPRALGRGLARAVGGPAEPAGESGPLRPFVRARVVTIALGGPIEMEHIVATVAPGAPNDTTLAAHAVPLTNAPFAGERRPRAPVPRFVSAYARDPRAIDTAVVCQYLHDLTDSLPALDVGDEPRAGTVVPNRSGTTPGGLGGAARR